MLIQCTFLILVIMPYAKSPSEELERLVHDKVGINMDNNPAVKEKIIRYLEYWRWVVSDLGKDIYKLKTTTNLV